jgi:PAS domain S-box-containing protein
VLKPYSHTGEDGIRSSPGVLVSPCRDILGCERDDCPAHNDGGIPCWHFPGTQCHTHQHIPTRHRLQQCLLCPVFHDHAQADARGWGGFVADELRLFIDLDSGGHSVKQLEQDLQFSEGNYRRLFEGSEDIIFITDRNGAFTDINRACSNLLGYATKDELLSLSSIDHVYEKTMHWVVFKKQIDRQGFVKDFEAQFKRKDGSILHCLLSGQAVRDAQGEIIGYQGIAKDITARMDAIRNFRQRHRELWVLNTVAFAMNRSQDLDYVLITALKKVLEVLDLSSGFICLIDHAKSEFVIRAELGFPEALSARSYCVTLVDRILMQALLKKSLRLTPEPIFPPFKAELTVGGAVPGVQLTCFLITAKHTASGFFAFDIPPGRDITVGHDYHLLGSLGNFLGGAIENKQLLQTIHLHREELRGLTAKLFHSQETERRRIARELHDEAGQALTGISFTLENLENQLARMPGPAKALLTEVKQQINSTYQEMRRLSHQLHPALLTDLGLEPALDAYLSSIAGHRPIKIDFNMVGFEKRVTPEIEGVLYRLSQEAITNTLKHARATSFGLSITKGYPCIIFIARDDGCGFDPDGFDGAKPALGLLSMRERVSMLGGKFSLRSAIGKGTRIRIEIPIMGEDDV